MLAHSVAVFGSSQSGSGTPPYRLAEELGRELARLGATVRCGGYGGVMEAVAAGAKSEGGHVVGCTLSWFAERRDPNRHLDEVHEAANLHTRIDCLLRGARGAVVLPGGVGTLNELFWVWTLLMHDREEGPDAIVLLGDMWDELLELLGRRFEVPAPLRSLVTVARTPREAAEAAWGKPSA